jgi:hypothetical protein
VAGEGVIKGVLEGFYGSPWSHADRLDLMRFAAAEGFDTWVHAPKDDPYHRERWRDPYPDDELALLAGLADEADRLGVAFAWAIAPGLSFDYDSERDFEQLVGKCSELRSAGIGQVQLLWDDIESRAADGQARVSNRLARELDQPTPLVVCPVDYAGTGDSPYRRAFRAALDPGVVVYWTGPEVVSAAITREELDAASGRFGGRALLLWDNYPVNDFAPERLFLGPLRGRDPRLFEGPAVGLAANGMVQAIPSKLALATVAAYLRDPEGYEPVAAFERALAAYGAEVVDALGAPARGGPAAASPAELVDALAPGVDAAGGAALLGPFV